MQGVLRGTRAMEKYEFEDRQKNDKLRFSSNVKLLMIEQKPRDSNSKNLDLSIDKKLSNNTLMEQVKPIVMKK